MEPVLAGLAGHMWHTAGRTCRAYVAQCWPDLPGLCGTVLNGLARPMWHTEGPVYLWLALTWRAHVEAVLAGGLAGRTGDTKKQKILKTSESFEMHFGDNSP